MLIGLVKWFDKTKGFGVISTPEKGEIFLHKSNCEVDCQHINEGLSLVFNISLERRKTTAIKARVPSSYDDLCIIFSYINKPNIVKETIFYKAVSQFFGNSSYDEMILLFKRYFDENYLSTAKEEFIEFLQAFRSVCFNFRRQRNNSLEHLFYFLRNVDKKLLFAVWSKKLDEMPERGLISLRVNRTLNDKVFEYPEDIFIDNYTSINFSELDRLLKHPKGEQIIVQVLLKKFETSDSINSYLYTIFSLIDKFENPQNISQTKDAISQNILNFFNEQYIRETNSLSDFNYTLKELNRHYNETEFSDLINHFSKTLSDDSILRLWRGTIYFKPETDFFHRNITKLNNWEFAQIPKDYHQYLKERLKEIGLIQGERSFALLVILISEIPTYLREEVFGEIPLIYKVVLWFTLQESNFTSRNYQSDSDTTDYKIDENEIIDYFKTADSFDEFGYLLSVAVKVQQKCHNLFSSYNNDGYFKLNYLEREEIIKDYLQNIDYDKDKIVRILYKSISGNYAVLLTKAIIPKFIQADEISSGSISIFDNFLHFNDGKVQKELFEYVERYASNNQQVKLFLEEHIDSIELSKVITGFHSIAINKQPDLLRRVFYLLHSKTISSTNDFYEQLILLLPKNNININVRICLKVLESLKENNGYVKENIISEVVCKYVNDNTQEIVQIDDLIEKCEGRTWMTTGEQERNWYLNIEGKNFPIDDNKVKIGDNYYQFNKDTRTVIVSGKNYNFRWHKVESEIYSRKYEIPNGITFCDAQKSEFDSTLKKQFYWCCNSKCYSPCQNDHLDFEWQKYSLRDFIKILDISFEDDSYYRFASLLNRANRLLQKLQCTSCNRLLRDSRTSEFAFYRVTTFHCTNPNCEEYHKVVYLNHCLNWKCLNVVDSRISEVCPNGWFICDKCDNCCSQEKIDIRYSNLLTNNAFNPNNSRHQRLKYQVDNKLGHLERGEVYDYKTGLKKANSNYKEESPS